MHSGKMKPRHYLRSGSPQVVPSCSRLRQTPKSPLKGLQGCFGFFYRIIKMTNNILLFRSTPFFRPCGAKNRGRSRLQSCYLGCDFVRQHADLRSGGTKGIPPGGRTRPAASAASEEEFIHLSAESRRGLRRINGLIGCGRRSPTSICGIFQAATAA